MVAEMLVRNGIDPVGTPSQHWTRGHWDGRTIRITYGLKFEPPRSLD
jgi:hypothetical protein